MLELFKFLELSMETPTNYSWFHLLFLALIIALTTVLIVFFRNTTDKKFRIILLILWGIMVLFEIYKQLTFTFRVNSAGDGLDISYQWYAFPFQLCSTPLYVLPVVIFAKEGKLRQACMAFSSFFAFFGGLAVMIFPGDVFMSQIGICIQTMIHHGFQVVTGIFISVWNRKNFNIKYWIPSIFVYLALISIACTMNGTAFLLYDNGVYTELHNFNMFYIRHDLTCSMPILSTIQPIVGPYAFFFIYFIGFVFVSFIMFGLQYLFIVLIPSLVFKKKDNENKDAEAC